MDLYSEGRVALITGASRGIGAAAARAFNWRRMVPLVGTMGRQREGPPWYQDGPKSLLLVSRREDTRKSRFHYPRSLLQTSEHVLMRESHLIVSGCKRGLFCLLIRSPGVFGENRCSGLKCEIPFLAAQTNLPAMAQSQINLLVPTQHRLLPGPLQRKPANASCFASCHCTTSFAACLADD